MNAFLSKVKRMLDGWYGIKPAKVDQFARIVAPSLTSLPVTIRAQVVGEGEVRDIIFSVKPGLRCLIGRAWGSDLTLNDRTVSPIHAVAELNDDALELADALSATGTSINERPLARGERRRVGGGDVLKFGKVKVRISRIYLGAPPGVERRCA